MTVRIYHNPRCSKSRATLALLEARGITPEIVRYLETPPTAAELATLQTQLGVPARDMVRRKEAAFTDLGLDAADDAALLAAVAAHPILLERPIVVAGDRAAIGRPPEAVAAILD